MQKKDKKYVSCNIFLIQIFSWKLAEGILPFTLLFVPNLNIRFPKQESLS